MNKFRQGKIKREHSIITGLLPLLERMERCVTIATITPGPISPHNSKETGLTFQYFTDIGLRLLGKNGSAVQEVWVVATDRQAALDWLQQDGLVTLPPAPPPAKPAKIPTSGPLQYCPMPWAGACNVCGRLLNEGTRVAWTGTWHVKYMHVRCAKGE